MSRVVLMFAMASLPGLLGCTPSEPGVVLFAAASTVDAVEDVSAAFEADTGVSVSVSAAGSSVLARQIESGADAAVFLSANADWVDRLAERKLVADRVDLLENALVAIVPKESSVTLVNPDDLLVDAIATIAVADPDGVPAGRYAKHALTAAGIWEQVESKLVPAADVRQALVYVERGEADAGLVYATDAAASERVTVAFRFDESATGPIVYPLVLTTAGASNENAQRFFAFMQTPDAAARFNSHGFRVR